MLSALYKCVLNRPALLRVVASVLWRIGCLGLLAGVVATAVTAILSTVAATTGGVSAGYQQVVPGLPTFWIPESPMGVGIYMTLMLTAYLVDDFARALQRALRF